MTAMIFPMCVHKVYEWSLILNTQWNKTIPMFLGFHHSNQPKKALQFSSKGTWSINFQIQWLIQSYPGSDSNTAISDFISVPSHICNYYLHNSLKTWFYHCQQLPTQTREAARFRVNKLSRASASTWGFLWGATPLCPVEIGVLTSWDCSWKRSLCD